MDYAKQTDSHSKKIQKRPSEFWTHNISVLMITYFYTVNIKEEVADSLSRL